MTVGQTTPAKFFTRNKLAAVGGAGMVACTLAAIIAAQATGAVLTFRTSAFTTARTFWTSPTTA